MKNGIFNRQSILELSLLAFFAIGLFFSKLIVDYKGRISLGFGISLPGAGLTVKLPQEYGWRGVKQWQYQQDNTLVLPACLMGRSGPIIEVSWRYMLTSTAQNSRDILNQFISGVEDDLPEAKSTAGGFPMDYIQLSSMEYGQQQFIGAAMLDFGRVITLQVNAKADPSLAQNVFLTLARSLEYKTPDEISRGVDLLKKARESGIDFIAVKPSRYYLIRDPAGSIRGNETIQVQIDPQQQLQINRTTSLLTTAVYQREHTFKSFRPFEEFGWRCQNSDAVRVLNIFSLKLQENGNLAIENSSGHIQTIRPGPAIVGEILLDWLVRYYLEFEQQPTVVDILYYDGIIVPARISSIPPDQAFGRTQDLAFAIRVEMLNGWLTEFYFDTDKNPLGKINQEAPRRVLLWEPVELEEIKKNAPKPPAPKGPMAKIKNMEEYAVLNFTKETCI